MPVEHRTLYYNNHHQFLGFMMGTTLFDFFGVIDSTEEPAPVPSRQYRVLYTILPDEHYNGIRRDKFITNECIEWLLRRVVTHPPVVLPNTSAVVI